MGHLSFRALAEAMSSLVYGEDVTGLGIPLGQKGAGVCVYREPMKHDHTCLRIGRGIEVSVETQIVFCDKILPWGHWEINLHPRDLPFVFC